MLLAYNHKTVMQELNYTINVYYMYFVVIKRFLNIIMPQFCIHMTRNFRK